MFGKLTPRTIYESNQTTSHGASGSGSSVSNPSTIVVEDRISPQYTAVQSRRNTTVSNTVPATPRDRTRDEGMNSAAANSSLLSCQLCNLRFKGKSGVTQHMRRAHPEQYNATINCSRARARWNSEEKHLLALEEAKYIMGTVPRYLNQALQALFPDRTIEAIKCRRNKSADHKELVQRCLVELREAQCGHSDVVRHQNVSELPMHITTDKDSTVNACPLVTATDGATASNFNYTPHLTREDLTLLDSSNDNFNLLSPDAAVLQPSYIEPTAIFKSYVSTLGSSRRMSRVPAQYQDIEMDLESIWSLVPAVSFGAIRSSVDDLVRKYFPVKPFSPSREGNARRPHSRRDRRRADYANIQNAFKRNRRMCIQAILSDTTSSRSLGRSLMEPFWTSIMTEKDETLRPPIEGIPPSMITALWDPITINDIDSNLLRHGTAPGRDNFSMKDFKSIPTPVWAKLFNLFMMLKWIPKSLLESRTIFLPKVSVPDRPGQFRPITISSVICRLFHKILTSRVAAGVSMSVKQRAFIKSDGCADNVYLLDKILRTQKDRHVPTYVLSLDLNKAFDSVDHEALLRILRIHGLPDEFVTYMRHVYSNSTTSFQGDDWVSEPLIPSRGVRQGDPLSPVVFNMCINYMINKLPEAVGVSFGTGMRLNCLAYADDIILLASSKKGMEDIVTVAAENLKACGLSINVEKSFAFCLRRECKGTRVQVCSNALEVNGKPVQMKGKTDIWTYLGVNFTCEGINQRHAKGLRSWLERLTSAPLKPQQRLYAARTVIIPKLYYDLSMNRVVSGRLVSLDKTVRQFVRGWLKLPKDIPVAFFHAAVRDGGLGLPSLRWMGPQLRHSRLQRFASLGLGATLGLGEEVYGHELRKLQSLLAHQGKRLDSADKIAEMFHTDLNRKVDGGGLSDCRATPSQSSWVSSGTKFLSGKDFVNSIKLRISALPTRARTSRGRDALDRTCRAGCTSGSVACAETLNHVLQRCHRTHGARIRRHDAVVAYVKRKVDRTDTECWAERRLSTSTGVYKPDLILRRGTTVHILDAQVVSDGISLAFAHNEKIKKYNKNEILETVRNEFGAVDIKLSTITLNWKGVWSRRAAAYLLDNQIISAADLSVLSSRVVIGGLACWNIFNTMIS